MKYINELKEEATFTINNERVLNSNKFAEVLIDKCIFLLKHHPEAIETLMTEFQLSDDINQYQEIIKDNNPDSMDGMNRCFDWIFKY